MTEALVGFLLFSTVLALYVPAFATALTQLTHAQHVTQHWRIFYELCQCATQSQPDSNQLNHLMTQYYTTTNERITQFACQHYSCHIQFEGGEAYEVTLQTVE